MPDGWISVTVTYGLVAAMLVVWFWMILRKLARQQRERRDG
jgi:hypothetical protein